MEYLCEDLLAEICKYLVHYSASSPFRLPLSLQLVCKKFYRIQFHRLLNRPLQEEQNLNFFFKWFANHCAHFPSLDDFRILDLPDHVNKHHPIAKLAATRFQGLDIRNLPILVLEKHYEFLLGLRHLKKLQISVVSQLERNFLFEIVAENPLLETLVITDTPQSDGGELDLRFIFSMRSLKTLHVTLKATKTIPNISELPFLENSGHYSPGTAPRALPDDNFFYLFRLYRTQPSGHSHFLVHSCEQRIILSDEVASDCVFIWLCANIPYLRVSKTIPFARELVIAEHPSHSKLASGTIDLRDLHNMRFLKKVEVNTPNRRIILDTSLYTYRGDAKDRRRIKPPPFPFPQNRQFSQLISIIDEKPWNDDKMKKTQPVLQKIKKCHQPQFTQVPKCVKHPKIRKFSNRFF